MENNVSSNSTNEDQDKLNRKFLKIKNVKVFSNAYNLRLREGDVIVGFNGEYFNSSYEDLKKEIDEIKKKEEKLVSEQAPPKKPSALGPIMGGFSSGIKTATSLGWDPFGNSPTG